MFFFVFFLKFIQFEVLKEWNLPVFITLMSILGVFLTIITGTVMKKLIYYFCYIFCCICCCCCRRKKQNSNKYDDFKKNKMKKYSKLDLYLEEKFNRDQMEDSDSDNEEMLALFSIYLF
jgi:hypothetical protein